MDLLAYAKFMIDELKLLNSVDSSDCYFWANPRKGTANKLFSIRNKYSRLLGKEVSIEARVMDSASNRKIPTEEQIRPLLAHIISVLRRRKDIDTSLIISGDISADKYKPYCKATIAFYEEVLKFPPKDRVSVLRHLFASR